jgi:hypothetical protein
VQTGEPNIECFGGVDDHTPIVENRIRLVKLFVEIPLHETPTNCRISDAYCLETRSYSIIPCSVRGHYLGRSLRSLRFLIAHESKLITDIH